VQSQTQRLLSFSQAMEGFLLAKAAEGRSPCTLADYAGSANKLAAWLDARDLGEAPVADLDTHHLRQFLADLRQRQPPLSPKSLKNVHTFLSSFWSWLGAEFGLPHMVRGTIQAPKAPPPAMKLPTPKDIERMLKACDYAREARTVGRQTFRMRRPTARRDKAIILTLIDTGVRARELCGLTVGDVDLSDGSALVRYGKGGKQRMVYLGKRARKALWRYLASDRPGARPDDALFVGLHGGPLAPNGLSQLVRKLGRRVGVDVSPHVLRHWFATEFLRGGGNTLVLRRLLGHVSDELLARYAEIAEADLRAAHERASPVDRLRL